jgi:hypothetical protein
LKPNAFTFVGRGVEQIRRYGVRLLWLRYVKRQQILRTEPLHCPDDAALEVHTQVCARDWLNCVWTMKSFGRFTGAQFGLLVLCDGTVTPEMRQELSRQFPGASVKPVIETYPAAAATFRGFPKLHELRADGRFFTLPKVLDSAALRRGELVLAIDPDVLFFSEPAEMLGDLSPTRGYFARLNLPRRDSDPRGAFCIDAVPLHERFGLELPLRFNCGLGSLNYSTVDWGLVDRILSELPPDPERAFMLDQTILAILSLANGWNPLPPERYVLEPVADLTGVVARHYYGKTRDLMYLEGIPRLARLGLLD